VDLSLARRASIPGNPVSWPGLQSIDMIGVAMKFHGLAEFA
jgi:hypothetical protein